MNEPCGATGIRRPSRKERAELVRLIRTIIETHGRGALRRAIEQAEVELTLPLTAHQQKQAEKRALWAEIDRELEQRRLAEAAAAEAERLRQEHTAEVRAEVYRDLGIRNGRTGPSLWAEWREMNVRREGLHKAIRVALREMGLVRHGPWFSLEAARTMRPAVEAIIAWDARRLAALSRRLEREGARIRSRRDRKARRPIDEVRRLRAEGVQIAEVARRVGMSRMSVYRIIAAIAEGRGT